MARRDRPGLIEELAGAVGRLHWGVGVTLAIVSFALFHFLAATPPKPLSAQSANFTQLGVMAGGALWHTLSGFLQFVVPAGLLIGAVISAIGRHRRASILADATDDPGSKLATLTWRDFERLIGDHFRCQGYVVMERGGASPDGGVDLELQHGADRVLVQCKHWRGRAVPVSVVRELYGVMTAAGVSRGMIVASGGLTQEAQAFVAGKNIDILAGPALHAALRSSRHASGDTPASVHDMLTPPVTTVPACPKCGAAMVRRTAARGQNAGRDFYGSSGFPRCTATLPVAANVG